MDTGTLHEPTGWDEDTCAQMLEAERAAAGFEALRAMEAHGANVARTERAAPVRRWAFFTGRPHGPERPAVIAERFSCPSCGAAAGERCRVGAQLAGAIHESRHQLARGAEWRQL